ncbi:MAG: tRNA (adenosine(37)-N6)-dimethylallyltransferase MiaA [Gemmatimonadales bacterium]|nr:MAG: tRNA (adenosine(37)-N6)-dimethylallyltransferase MiaA [Gemmatimonadales bacterium]
MTEAPEGLAIVGPTASGKTALSLPVAEALEAEIISMDSRQVYRGMDIGTAKVASRDRSRVPHFGLDLIDPRERYSAARFAREARGWMAEIRERGRLPLLVGGTGFFLKALTDPIFREPPLDEERRERLRGWLSGRSEEELAHWLRRLDPDRAELAIEGGAQRVGRTLEVALLTGRPLSWWHAHSPSAARPVRFGVVRLIVPRETLYARINARAEAMFEAGLLAEVRALLEAGVPVEAPGMTGTGYREAAGVLLGELALDEAIDAVQRATRRYARRQETWFRHQLPAEVLEIDATRPLASQVERVLEWWPGTAARAKG